VILPTKENIHLRRIPDIGMKIICLRVSYYKDGRADFAPLCCRKMILAELLDRKIRVNARLL